MKCWGWNPSGQLGQNNKTTQSTNNNIGDHADRSVAKASVIDLGLSANQNIRMISVGGNTSCIQTDDNKAKCWGDNQRGQLGQNNTVNYGSSSTSTVAGLNFINLGLSSGGTALTSQNIYTGGQHTCVLLNDDSTKCFGNNFFGQLGQNDNQSHGSVNQGGGNDPVQNGICNGTGNDAKFSGGEICRVEGLPVIDLGCRTGRSNCPANDLYKAKFIQCSSNGYHTCAVLRTDGQDMTDKVKCWGYNNEGQLGKNNTTNISDSNSRRLANASVIDLANFRICRLNQPFPDYNVVNGQCVPSCEEACRLRARTTRGECASGNDCDDTTNYNITNLPPAYDQQKCCLRRAK